MNTSKAISVTDLKTGKEYAIEIVHGTFLLMIFQNGLFSEVAKKPDDCLFRIEYDCPFLFPLENQTKSLPFKNKTFTYSHWTEKRGNHRFSTLDVYHLKCFSSFQIDGELTDLGVNVAGRKVGEGATAIATKCLEILNYLNKQINTISPDPIDLDNNKILSIRIALGRKGNPPQELASIVIPYNREIDLRFSGEKMKYIDPNELHEFLNEKSVIKKYFDENLEKPEKDLSFINTVFKFTHDFAFYVNERPEAISKLREELIRDLFLIPIKAYDFPAEAEAYIYDGKLDYRITNTKNKYEIISGEFKIWTGIESFKKCYLQISEKHSTGNETEVYLIMINKNNKNIHDIYEQMIINLKQNYSFEKTISSNISLSKAQLFSRHQINIKGHSVPIVIGLINAYHEKV